MNDRIMNLRKTSLNVKPSISLERARLYTEAYQLYSGEFSIPEMRALALRHYMTYRKLSVNEGELIVGEKGPQLQTAPTFPELCCHTVEDLKIMNIRDKIAFKVTEEDLSLQEKTIIPYWESINLRDEMLNLMTGEWKACYAAGIFTEFMEQRAPGHTVADGKMYENGFDHLLEKIEESKKNHIHDPDKMNELKAMAIAIEALYVYADRYRKLLLKKHDEEIDLKRKDELKRMADNFLIIPRKKPESFHQALQMYWLVHIAVTSELNNWDAYSPGRLDQHLNPFYNDEISKEEAIELLQNFWIKFNNQPAPPKVGVTLKESGTYTDFANINTGGLTISGEDGVNPVSYLILEVMDEMKLTQPSSNVQISEKTPHDFVLKAASISRKGWGQPAFYNSEAIVKELVNAGKKLEDAYYGGASGCVETGAFGREAYILTGYLNIAKILEITLFGGYDPITHQQLGLYIDQMDTFDDFYSAFEKQMEHFIQIKMAGNDKIEKLYAKKMPAPLLSVLVDDCIINGKDYNAGGARYNTRYIQGVGIGTVTDSLSSIKFNVYDKQKTTMNELKEALLCNYDGYPRLYNLVQNHTPKYGNDDDYADALMKKAFDTFYRLVTNKESICGFTYRINMLPTTSHVYFGEVLGATPDGRLKSKPVSEGISPSKSADILGPTAVVKSASKMPHELTGGTLLNQKFLPEAISGEKGLDLFVAYIRSYFKLGGHHIQFNVFDKEQLLKAQINPDEYRNLIVRVAGYSDYFNNLNPILQDEIIERTEQRFN